MNNNYISHHGIPGMKWGKQNGPPYPLGSSQMSFLERRRAKKAAKTEAKKEQAARKAEERKNRAITSGDAHHVYSERRNMTNQELRQAIERIELERKLTSLTTPEKKSGWDTVKTISENINTASKLVSSVSGMYSSINSLHKNHDTYKDYKDKKKEASAAETEEKKKEKKREIEIW